MTCWTSLNTAAFFCLIFVWCVFYHPLIHSMDNSRLVSDCLVNMQRPWDWTPVIWKLLVSMACLGHLLEYIYNSTALDVPVFKFSYSTMLLFHKDVDNMFLTHCINSSSLIFIKLVSKTNGISVSISFLLHETKFCYA